MLSFKYEAVNLTSRIIGDAGRTPHCRDLGMEEYKARSASLQ
jgi:hypothetical protein